MFVVLCRVVVLCRFGYLWCSVYLMLKCLYVELWFWLFRYVVVSLCGWVNMWLGQYVVVSSYVVSNEVVLSDISSIVFNAVRV